MHPVDINAALLKLGYTHRSIASELKVSPPMVSQVVWGRSKSRRVAEHIARLLDQPIEMVFDDLAAPTPRQALFVAAA